jgi:hypothetical protein
VHRKTLIRELERSRKWVLSKRGKANSAGDPWTAQSIMVGAVQAISQCGESIREWARRRKDRRRVLRDVKNRYNSPPGNKVLRDLVRLAMAVVGACSWKDEFWLGALPVRKEPRQLDVAHKRALAEGAARARAEEREMLEALRKRRSVEVTSLDTTPA